MVVPVIVAPKPQNERAQTTETPYSEPKTRFGEYPGVKEGLHFDVMYSHRRLTWLLEMPDKPIALTRSSTERVEMP